MSRRRYRLPGGGPSWPNLRWGGLFLAVLAGLLIGWRIFLAAPPTSEAHPTTVEGMDQLSEFDPTATVALPVSGTPSRGFGGSVLVGTRAPDFTLFDLSGARVSLSSRRGEVVLINFWTTWCPPCRLEMPALQNAFEAYGDRGFTVLGVNWTQVDKPDQVAPFVQELGLTFPILLDEGGDVSEGLYDILGLPTSIFLDREGVVKDIVIGPLALEELDVKIEALLEGPS